MGKAWLTKYKETCRDILALIAICIVSFALGWYTRGLYEEHRIRAIVWEAIEELPEPEQCALCSEGRPYQAPCLINLSTGQMGELRVYTYGPTEQGKLDPREARFSGTFNFQPCAGLAAIRDTDFHTCQVTLPEERERMNPAHFCKECRLLLAGAGLEGYVLVDLYDQNNVQAYPIRYEIIRDYRVSVTNRKDGTRSVCVTGLLDFEKE